MIEVIEDRDTGTMYRLQSKGSTFRTPFPILYGSNNSLMRVLSVYSLIPFVLTLPLSFDSFLYQRPFQIGTGLGVPFNPPFHMGVLTGTEFSFLDRK